MPDLVSAHAMQPPTSSPSLLVVFALSVSAGCGGATTRPATPPVVAAVRGMLASGCVSPDGQALVLRDADADGPGHVVGVRTLNGDVLFQAAAGDIVYCDEAGVVLARRVSEDQATSLQVMLLDYETGRPRWPAQRLPLPDCARLGDITFHPGPGASAAGFSWSVFAHWSGGYPPSPREQEEARCDERGGVRIDREDGRLSAGPYIVWRLPEDEMNRVGVVTVGDLELSEDIHSIDLCQPSSEPVASRISARRAGATLWSRSVPSPMAGPSCVP